MSRKVSLVLKDLPRVPVYAFFWVLYALSHLMPRSKRVWLFDEWEGERFADNGRYLYLHILAHEPGIKAIWLAHSNVLLRELRERGLPAHHAYSLRGLWYTLRAKVIIVESHISAFYFLTGGILKINLWHGLPIKKIVYDSAQTKVHNWVYTSKGLRRAYHVFFQPHKVALGDYVLAQSPAWRDFFSSAFRVKHAYVIVENQPRNEAFLQERPLMLKSEKTLIDEMEERRKTRKVITYLPTFRDGSSNPLAGSGLDFSKLDVFLGNNGMYMYIKMHHERAPDGAPVYQNLSFLPAEIGAMLPLRSTDILLTDYSSVFFEFLVTNRPVVFFSFDLATYLGTMREMYFEYEAITPGPKAKTVSELERHLVDAAVHPEMYAEARAKIRTMVLNPQPEKSASQVFARIKEIVG